MRAAERESSDDPGRGDGDGDARRSRDPGEDEDFASGLPDRRREAIRAERSGALRHLMPVRQRLLAVVGAQSQHLPAQRERERGQRRHSEQHRRAQRPAPAVIADLALIGVLGDPLPGGPGQPPVPVSEQRVHGGAGPSPGTGHEQRAEGLVELSPGA
jgi:hypothetical protein